MNEIIHSHNRLVEITSLTDYISQVIKLTPKKEESLYHRELVFRGLSSESYELDPSLARKPSEHWINTLVSVEKDLISEALQKYPSIFRNDDLPITKLAKLQHFGIPTRMMDVTTNALVALYFACRRSKKYPDDNGEVVVFSDYALPVIDTYANIIADTYCLTQNSFTQLENYYYRGIKQDYSISLQYPNWEVDHSNSIKSFHSRISHPIIVNAVEGSTRQKNQQGKFILFPNSLYEEKGQLYVTGDLVKLSKEDERVIKQIIIPANLKTELLNQLSVLGITTEVLFADSIEAVFEGVKKHQESRYS